MRKELLKSVMAIIAVLPVSVLVWFLVHDSHVSVYVDFRLDTPAATIQRTQEQFRSATGNRLHLNCKEQVKLKLTPSSREEIPAIGCHAEYTADNFVQLVRYQNRLFNIAERENLEFASIVVDGVFIAKWLD